MNTLITAASSAKAHQLKNKLGTESIILGDFMDLPAFMLKQTGMVKLPGPQSVAYTHEMLTLCLDKGINKVYTLTQDEFDTLNKAAQLFNEYGIEIVNGLLAID
ncbi:hypothetical protein [Mucilaginibacter sp.]|uniref:hypothetical protein n=1 Tax=Mucilaginibacter sp. TaxID=1882438 RepID=UPI003D10145E